LQGTNSGPWAHLGRGSELVAGANASAPHNARGLRASTINAVKTSTAGPWEVPELEIRECPPSMLENINDGPPWEVGPELEVRERPPSTLENVDDRPPGRWCKS
jgi:hypothetical protein